MSPYEEFTYSNLPWPLDNRKNPNDLENQIQFYCIYKIIILRILFILFGVHFINSSSNFCIFSNFDLI